MSECHTVMNLAHSVTINAKSKGKVSIIIPVKSSIRSVDLHNTLCVENLRTNLMSVSKITDSGSQVLFKKDKALVKDKHGNVRMMANWNGNLYYVRENRESIRFAGPTNKNSNKIDL